MTDKYNKYINYVVDDVLSKTYTERGGRDVIMPTVGNRFNLTLQMGHKRYLEMYKEYFDKYVIYTYGARDMDLQLLWDTFKMKAIKKFWYGW
jgi:hypothetical protein